MDLPELFQVVDDIDLFGTQGFQGKADETVGEGDGEELHHLAVDGDGAVAFEEDDLWAFVAFWHGRPFLLELISTIPDSEDNTRQGQLQGTKRRS